VAVLLWRRWVLVEAAPGSAHQPGSDLFGMKAFIEMPSQAQSSKQRQELFSLPWDWTCAVPVVRLPMGNPRGGVRRDRGGRRVVVLRRTRREAGHTGRRALAPGRLEALGEQIVLRGFEPKRAAIPGRTLRAQENALVRPARAEIIATEWPFWAGAALLLKSGETDTERRVTTVGGVRVETDRAEALGRDRVGSPDLVGAGGPADVVRYALSAAETKSRESRQARVRSHAAAILHWARS
jgi:hypothetical protein